MNTMSDTIKLTIWPTKFAIASKTGSFTDQDKIDVMDWKTCPIGEIVFACNIGKTEYRPDQSKAPYVPVDMTKFGQANVQLVNSIRNDDVSEAIRAYSMLIYDLNVGFIWKEAKKIFEVKK